MKVLIACAFSGITRDLFEELGHDSWSCDLLPCDRGGKHIQGDVLEILDEGWDLMIAHPTCTHLCSSGARWWPEKKKDGRQESGIKFFMELVNAPINKVCVENPIGIMSTVYRKPDQIIQPWMFGHGETKATCYWLKNLPKLNPTNVVEGREARIHRLPPSPDRWKERSKCFEGVAKAMADQWGQL